MLLWCHSRTFMHLWISLHQLLSSSQLATYLFSYHSLIFVTAILLVLIQFYWVCHFHSQSKLISTPFFTSFSLFTVSAWMCCSCTTLSSSKYCQLTQHFSAVISHTLQYLLFLSRNPPFSLWSFPHTQLSHSSLSCTHQSLTSFYFHSYSLCPFSVLT
jgi:hypothetical protein